MAEADTQRKRKQPEPAKDKSLASAENPRSAKAMRSSSQGESLDVEVYNTDAEFILQLVLTSCDQLRVPQNTVFVAERTDKIVDVFRGMVKHNFLSVPVLQKTDRKWYGFIDMADIVHYVVETLGAAKLQSSEDFWSLFDKEEEFRTKTVKDFMKYPLSRRNPFHPVKTGYSLFHVVECLAREHDLHRVPIVDNDRQLMNLITQSQIAKYLYGNMGKIGPKMNKPLRLVRDAIKDVISVAVTQPTIDAFALMVKENISGVAVVDESGALRGALSVRDLKAVAPDAALFWRLYQPTGTFLGKLNREFSDSRPSRPQYCTTDDTIETALTILVENKIHRVFIVDDLKKPIGVFSLKDLLSELISM